jgi:short-subunit dehydrogenase
MHMPNPDLNAKTIVITGASSGFGRGSAEKLAAEGANVVLAARRANLIEELANQITARGGKALAVTTDVSNAVDVGVLKDQAVERFGKVDVWINNVGVGALGYFWDIPIEDHARIIDVNLKGLIYGAHAALGLFRAQGHGTLVNVGSIDSEVPLAYQASYAASKAAVLSLSRSLNEELRLTKQQGIKVATIMPWAVDTPWWTHAANYTGHEPRMMAMDDPQIVIDAIVRACTDPEEEMPVGLTAKASNLSHLLFPDLTERLSANIADREVKKAWPAPNTTGSIYEPMAEGAGIGGGIRERMKREDHDAANDGEPSIAEPTGALGNQVGREPIARWSTN